MPATTTSSAPGRWFVLLPAFILLVLTAKLLYFGSLLSRGLWVPLSAPFAEPIPQFYAATATLGCLAIAFAAVLRLGRLGLLVASTLYVLVSLAAMADLIHASFFGCVIPIRRLAQWRMLDDVAKAMASQWRWPYAFLLADLPLLGVATVLAWRHGPREVPARSLWASAVALVVAAMLIAPTLGLLRKTTGGMAAFVGLQGEIVGFIGILPYHLLDVAASVTDAFAATSDEGRRVVADWFDERKARAAQRSALFGAARGSNVIQISAESLQAFPIGLRVAGQEVTPRLNELARESLYFTQFFDQTGIGTTADAEFMINHSLYPLADDIVSLGHSRNRWRASATVLREHGYTTLSACGADASFWQMSTMHKGFGFSSSTFKDGFGPSDVDPWNWISDDEFFRQSVALLTQQPAPFFAYLLTSSNHGPYNVPDKDRVLNLESISDEALARYLHSVHRFDRAFGGFFDGLKAAGVLDTTLLVVYGDHQGLLADSEAMTTLLGVAKDDQFALWKNRKRVPLFIRLPGGRFAGHRANVGGQLDIAPTILALLGIGSEDEVMMGQDLSGGDSAMVVFRDGSYVDGRHYFINYFGPIERSRCFAYADDRPTPCAALEGGRAEALRRLAISDMVVKADLVPDVRASRHVSAQRR